MGTLTDGVHTLDRRRARRLRLGDDVAADLPDLDRDRDGTQDISFTYDPSRLPADPNGQPFLVGAENEIGQGAMSAVLPTTDLVVTSTTPVPAESLAYSVTVLGIKPGAGR